MDQYVLILKAINRAHEEASEAVAVAQNAAREQAELTAQFAADFNAAPTSERADVARRYAKNLAMTDFVVSQASAYAAEQCMVANLFGLRVPILNSN